MLLLACQITELAWYKERYLWNHRFRSDVSEGILSLSKFYVLNINSAFISSNLKLDSPYLSWLFLNNYCSKSVIWRLWQRWIIHRGSTFGILQMKICPNIWVRSVVEIGLKFPVSTTTHGYFMFPNVLIEIIPILLKNQFAFHELFLIVNRSYFVVI